MSKKIKVGDLVIQREVLREEFGDCGVGLVKEESESAYSDKNVWIEVRWGRNGTSALQWSQWVYREQVRRLTPLEALAAQA